MDIRRSSNGEEAVRKDHLSIMDSEALNRLVRNTVCANIPNAKIFLMTSATGTTCIRVLGCILEESVAITLLTTVSPS